ncbi:hypothetical protein ALC62_13308 [Cyphomyrmex costatus]|uniref:DUF4218 domain-containing protein n=1 Tax=Cyphomyrmex costatus TaxID=456900 RepID=A0A151IA40_9HYME|nr:hypothetical protein ALC62_13308 [Cyphomyrmex costatus]
MALIGVEFFSLENENEGGLGVVHKSWLTPLKKESFWPQHIKQQHLFNKCLRKGEEPDEQWQLYKIKRIYFETDDLIKANAKIKKLQFTSDVGSEIEENQVTLKRKRQCPKRLQSSSSEEEEEEENDYCLQTKKLSSTILARPPLVQSLVQQKIIVPVNIGISHTFSSDDRDDLSDIISNRNESSDNLFNFENSDFDFVNFKCTDSEQVMGNNSSKFEESSNNSLWNSLRKWAISNVNVPLVAINSLLHILVPLHPELPLDVRTLLKTPSKINVKMMETGEFVYMGLQNAIEQHLTHNLNFVNSIINLTFNVDGLPLFKSSNTQLWPILGLIQNSNDKTPFPIGIFCGTSKSNPLSSFLEEFIEELSLLLKDGFYFNDILYRVTVHSFVCDAPARSYLKCIKSHSDINADLRNDDTFKSKQDEDHHIGNSPLLQLNIGLVTSFPIDYMHNVCLGVMRKLLQCWINGNFRVRLSANSVQTLSDKMVALHNFIPKEINRKPRPLRELARFKATEFRTFLLYLGPVLLYNVVDKAVYEHFLLLHSAIVILCSKRHISVLGHKTASQLLSIFVEHSEHLYGLEFLIYNVHCLIHLPEDVAMYGPLDKFSAFPFENFLGKLKRLIKSAKQPLIQLCKRLHEANLQISSEKENLLTSHLLEHCHGPTIPLISFCKQYKKIIFKNFMLSTYSFSQADCYCIINNKVIQIHNFVTHKDNSTSIIGKKFLSYSSLYTYPFNSRDLNIFKINDISSDVELWPITNVYCKTFVFPFKNCYVSFPILHTSQL